MLGSILLFQNKRFNVKKTKPYFITTGFHCSIFSGFLQKCYSTNSEQLSKIKRSNKSIKSESFKDLVLQYKSFNESIFIESLMLNLRLNTVYDVLILVSYSNIYKTYTCGRQRGIFISDCHDLSYYRSLYVIITDLLEDIMSEYGLDTYPDFVTIRYRQNKSTLLNSSVISLALENKTTSVKQNKIQFSKLDYFSKYLPLGVATNKFANSIELETKHKYLNNLIAKVKLSKKYFLSILKSPFFIENCRVFLNFTSKNHKYLIIELKLKDINELSSLVTLDSLNPIVKSLFSYENYELSYKVVFDYTSGLLLREIIDIITQNKQIRVIGSSYLSQELKTNKLIEYNRYKQLDNIKIPNLIHRPKNMPSNKFGVLDIETLFDSKNNISKVYALGFVTSSEPENINTFYLSDISSTLDSNYLIIHCINNLLISKYHNYIFYIHNMGNFDAIFIYKVLKEYNLHYGSDHYKLDCIFRDNKIIKLSVKIKHNNRYIKITLVDSYNLLTNSLYKLSRDFGVNTKKGYFPYSFVNLTNLNYVGPTPNIKLFNNIPIDEYNRYHLKSDWNLKEESLKYLELDLKSLLEVLEKFNYSLFLNHNIQMCDGLTISRLALNKFQFNYLNDSNLKLPLINNLEYFNFIYFGYYGGITEVYKPYGVNLNYYDVNSLYPYASLNPMPGCDLNYLESFTNEGLNLEDLFGFFQAEIETNQQYLGLLPVKTKQGLIFPNGRFLGIWSSEELKFAKSKGYKIRVIKGYNFSKIENVFTEYVQGLYDKKAQSSGSEKAVNKSLLNNLLGRFGLNIIKPKTKSLNSNELDYISSTRHIFSITNVTDNDFLVNYNPIISEEICLEHNLDYIKVLNNERNFKLDKQLDLYQDVSIAISAMTTSYARIFMNKIKLYIIEKGGKIYYSDTDSIVTDIDISKWDCNLVGKGLGKFKLEYKIKEGYFISNKTYCLVLEDGSSIIKAKGVNSESLTVENFKDMLFKTKNISALRKSSIKNWSKGSVIIEDKEIYLSSNAFSKRNKIFNDKDIWIDTLPLQYNNIDRELVVKN